MYMCEYSVGRTLHVGEDQGGVRAGTRDTLGRGGQQVTLHGVGGDGDREGA